jgi:dinuclear metal center YbgI/SA1388 family protein
MLLKEIVDLLDELAPFELQAEWDNSGVCVGDLNAQIKNIYLSLDADLDVLKQMEPNSLLIVHHPPIFKGLKNLIDEGYPNALLVEAIKRNISIVAMHTNYDLSHLNSFVLTEVLGYEEIDRDEYILYFDVNKSFDEFANEIADRLELNAISCVKASEYIKTAALTTGSGADLMPKVKSDCFLTGDIKYHTAKEALECGLSLIDIRHYESERYFAPSLQRLLQNKGINGIIANSKNPFTTIKGKSDE